MSAAMLCSTRLQASVSVKASRPSRISSVVCRAEEKAIAKVDRSKDTLYIGASKASLAYLDGSLPADFGFDPLGMLDPANSGGFIEPRWLQYAEVMNARWAMLGAAGLITPEILGAVGVIPPETAIVWWRSGVIAPAGSPDYWMDPWALFFIEVVLMQFAELKRIQDFRKPGSQGKQYFLGMEGAFKGSGEPAYPGGPFFNILNFGKNPAEIKTLRTKELKNGRLAMIAVLGYGAQAFLTQEGPFKNLTDHLADPANNNILTNLGHIYGQ
ncbi:MAG: hypothetical protein WDW36_001131 [Sanguina aurantia]